MAGADTCQEEEESSTSNNGIWQCFGNKLVGVRDDLKEIYQVSCSTLQSCFHMFKPQNCRTAEIKKKSRVDYGDNVMPKVFQPRVIVDHRQRETCGNPKHVIHLQKSQNTAPILKIRQGRGSCESYDLAGIVNKKPVAMNLGVNGDICFGDKITIEPSDISEDVEVQANRLLVQNEKEQNVADDTNRNITAKERPVHDLAAEMKDTDSMVLSNNMLLRKTAEDEFSEGPEKGNNSDVLAKIKTEIIEGFYQENSGVKPDEAVLLTGVAAAGKNDQSKKYTKMENEPGEVASINNLATKKDDAHAFTIQKNPADAGSVAEPSVSVEKCKEAEVKNTKRAGKNVDLVKKYERNGNETKFLRRMTAGEDVADIHKFSYMNISTIQMKQPTTEEYQILVIEAKGLVFCDVSYLLSFWVLLLNCGAVILIDAKDLRWIKIVFIAVENTFISYTFFNWIVLLFMLKLLTTQPNPHRFGNEFQKQNFGSISKDGYANRGKSNPKYFYKMALTKKSDNFKEASRSMYKGLEMSIKDAKKKFPNFALPKCESRKEFTCPEHLLQFRDLFELEPIFVLAVPWSSLDYFVVESLNDPNFSVRDAMHIELLRMSTLGYLNLPLNVSFPLAQLSREGFYYDETSGEIVCHSCESRSPEHRLMEVEGNLNNLHRFDCHHIAGTDYRNFPISPCPPHTPLPDVLLAITGLGGNARQAEENITQGLDDSTNSSQNVETLYDRPTARTENITQGLDDSTNLSQNVEILYDRTTARTENITQGLDDSTNLSQNVEILYDRTTARTENITQGLDDSTNPSQIVETLYDRPTARTVGQNGCCDVPVKKDVISSNGDELQARGSSSQNQTFSRNWRIKYQKEYSSMVTREDFRCLQRENEEMKRQRTCHICKNNRVHLVFLPCGHLVCCEDCGECYTRKHEKCFICNCVIEGVIKSIILQ